MQGLDDLKKDVRGASAHSDVTTQLTEEVPCQRLLSYAHSYFIISNAENTSVELPSVAVSVGRPLMLIARDITHPVTVKDSETGSTVGTLTATGDYLFIVSTFYDWVTISTI